MRLHIGQAVQRVSLVALACAVALAAFTSALTIAELHDHDCTGDGCPTCVVLDMAQAMLGSAAAPAALSVAGAAAIMASIFALATWAFALPARTPVSEKVLLLI